MKRFPVIGESFDIPWSVAEVVYKGYSQDYPGRQTLERLAERGGFSVWELDYYFPLWREQVKWVEQWESKPPALIGD